MGAIQLSRQAAQSESAAPANLTSAQAAYERRVRELDQLIARLRNPASPCSRRRFTHVPAHAREMPISAAP